MKRAHPFELLFARPPAQLPKSADPTVVINGRRVSDPGQLVDQALDDDELAAAKVELLRIRNRARYQRDRQDPKKMARRQAYYEANREKIRAYKREYDRRNSQQKRQGQADWARRQRMARRDEINARAREYYAKHRERAIELSRVKRAARREAAGLPPVRSYEQQPHWTVARHAWLRHVASDPMNTRVRGSVAHWCMQFGWTEWQCDRCGRVVYHEQLTQAGRQVLAAWDAQHPERHG